MYPNCSSLTFALAAALVVVYTYRFSVLRAFDDNKARHLRNGSIETASILLAILYMAVVRTLTEALHCARVTTACIILRLFQTKDSSVHNRIWRHRCVGTSPMFDRVYLVP